MSAADKDNLKPGPRPDPKQGFARAVKGPNQPDWTDGLKRLYDSVVEEPLPDSFKELLSRLDDDGK